MLTTLSLAAIACATLFPASGEEPIGAHFCIVCGTAGGVDTVLNIILFLPLGAGLALLGVPATRAILLVAALSTLIESAQLTIIPGRDATLGDVLSNTLGGALGFCASFYARAWLRPVPRRALVFLAAWGLVSLAIQTISSASFTPSIPTLEYYGQLAPVLGHFALFRGQVLAARIGDLAIPATLVPDSRALRHELIAGATNTAIVGRVAPSNDIAPVLRVVDTRGREIIMLAQRDADLIFGVRTIAAALKLRAPEFALAGAFAQPDMPLGTGVDTLVLSGQYLTSQVTLTATANGKSERRVIPVNASLAWTLLLPSQWYIRGTHGERALGWLWIAGLVLPLGYWAVLSIPPPRTRPFAVPIGAVVLVLAFVLGGFYVAPRMFSLSPTSVGEWLAVLVGLIIGALLTGIVGVRETTVNDGKGASAA